MSNSAIIFSRPAIWYPGMEEEEWINETDQMLAVAIAVHSFNAGFISFQDFEDTLNENSLDPIQANKDWSNGIFYS